MGGAVAPPISGTVKKYLDSDMCWGEDASARQLPSRRRP